MVPGRSSVVCRLKSTGVPSSLLRRPRPIEQTLTLPVQVPKTVGLQPERQAAKQEMTSKVSGRWPAECGMPTAAKLTNVEITQARNLDVERRAVWQCRTDLYARHDAQDWGEAVLPRSPLAIW